ncbi:hypothetical protein [Leptospira weilii]|uniref:hypothetical protein n=1 Tax=Leptospira weilii TaxID=28184 RepID=UPI0002487BB4|nr:hypothetical protein [Leptospira weilii]MCL8268367.1 hypothetical protein [Leptospira weilii]QDK22986.1 hypothetical protein FHG67_09855 [Leptospira weilii]QDK27370.1 hypothetical protein FHG68_12380 [Leptospira weilii]
MKALSIQQPWAWLIIRPDLPDPKDRAIAWNNKEIKDVENRNWKTNFRGRFLIHASQKFDHEGLEYIQKNYKLCLRMTVNDFDFGCIIGASILSDCVEHSDSKFFFGKYGYILNDSKPFFPIPYKGKLGFFEVDI